jgi:putative heme-binding domain-containing protein
MKASNPLRLFRWCLVASLGLWMAAPAVGARVPGLRLPPGFEATEVADGALANDIFCMTLDPQGRPVVSGLGYIRILVDDDGDGRADRALDFARAPADGAMGLWWEGDTLWCMGDGGLRRYPNASGAGRERPSELVLPLKTGGEHDAHAIRRGPDGWLYLLCGNHTGIGPKHASLPTSPIREPVAGCVLRIPPDLKGSEIVADGFRNPYGMDFNTDGELFTFDSDNERCVALPWYEPTRCYHVVPGGHHGWLSPQRTETWRLPPYFPDVVPPIVTLGRGSPTGVVCYRHVQFPEKYRGCLFLCDWTFGRIWAVHLERSGSSYVGKPELFLEAVGENGFAPTAAAVHPITGDLYVSIGGRGTRGAVYRIRYPAGMAGVDAAAVRRLQPAPRSLDLQPRWDILAPALGKDIFQRRRALELMCRHRKHFSPNQLWAAITYKMDLQDRLISNLVRTLFAGFDQEGQRSASNDVGCPAAGITFALATEDARWAEHFLADERLPPVYRLAAVRAIQRALGGQGAVSARGTAWEGYSRRGDASLPAAVVASLRKVFPSEAPALDRELSRTLAMIEDDDSGLLDRVARRCTADSDPVEDLHYLLVLARLRGSRSEAITRRCADTLLALDRKLTHLHLARDNNWPLRVAELHAALVRRDSRLNDALLGHAEFGRPDHVLFTRCPGFNRRKAAAVFLDRAAADSGFAWNAELIDLLKELPPARTVSLLRRLWGEAGLDSAILPLLARDPRPEDRSRFLAGLNSPQAASVRMALDALEKLPASPLEAGEATALVLALRRLPAEKAADPLRQRLEEALRQRTGERLSGAAAWTGWLQRKYPDRAARVANPDGVDVAAWQRRLAGIDWSRGDAGRGRAVFVKASCATCHSGSQALGPDLRGVGRRFSRADLFTAIVQPSKDVSPRYRTTQIITADDRVYQGLVVYEAVDSLLLQTGPATTVRLTNPQVRERRQSELSLMPAGLLDRLTDAEIEDLYAYLLSLSP